MSAQIVLLHLSDIHFQRWRLDGTSYDVDAAVRDELETDAKELCAPIGPVSGVLLTGDLAYAADPREYQAAVEWLGKLCSKIRCPPEAVWTVPGNHDVDRGTTDTRLTALVQADLRKDPSSLPGLLADTTCARALFEPLKAYNEFAGVFGCDFGPQQPPSDGSKTGPRLVWHKNLPLNDASTLRLCGLNSTLTSSRLDDPNMRLLVLGDVSPFLKREEGVAYLSLCHHPPDWLIDGDRAEDLLANRLHIQLFGHKHSQRVRTIGKMLRIVAGATHPERKEQNWEPRYNVLSLSVVGEPTRVLRVNVYARVWQPSKLKFFADTTDCKPGEEASSWDVPLDAWKPPPTSEGTTVTPASPSAPEAHSTEASPMDPARRLTYRFLTLPHHKRIAVAVELDLMRDEDSELPDRELFARVFDRARERKLLAALWRAVEIRHADPNPNPNPFDGR
jgi:GTPase-associated adaptor domain-containing protein/calcineurin-like phosphoesterase family protein